MEGLIFLLVTGIVVTAIVVAMKSLEKAFQKEKLCPHCYYQGKFTKRLGGNAAVELLLYMFFILPGIVYTSHRHRSSKDICPECDQDQGLPIKSKRAIELLEQRKAVGE